MTNPDPLSNATSADILARVRPQIEQIPLPHGYNITWGGDAESSSEAQQGLFSTPAVRLSGDVHHYRVDV